MQNPFDMINQRQVPMARATAPGYNTAASPAPVTPPDNYLARTMQSPLPPLDTIDPRRVWASNVIQQAWRSSKRRKRFMEMIRRGMRRKKYLEERRKLTGRIRDNEATLRKMGELLEKPGGAGKIIEMADKSEHNAASKIQSAWKGYRTRSKMRFVVGSAKQAKACRAMQKIYRESTFKNKMRESQMEARKENCFAQSTTKEMWQKHEDRAVCARTARLGDPDKLRNQAPSELKNVAIDQYIQFLKDARGRRLNAAHCFNFRQEMKMYQAELESTGGFDGQLNQRGKFGIASKKYSKAAEEKHTWRMKISRDMEKYGVVVGEDSEGGPEGPEFVFETSEEAAEAEAILHDLEKTLSYDFRPFKLPDADEVAYPDIAKHETREQRFSKAKLRDAIDLDHPRMLDVDDLHAGPLMVLPDA